MKIVHINYSDLQGGASIACYRLHSSLLNQKIDSNLVVAKKISQNDKVFTFKNKSTQIYYNIKKNISKIFAKLIEIITKNNYSFSFFRSKLSEEIKHLNPSIINLHWICNETISFKELRELKRPVIWTLCDMWPFLGAEHNDFSLHESNYWNDMEILNSRRFNINNVALKKKVKELNFQIEIVAISSWLAEKAKKSILFKGKKIQVIPCCLNFDEWTPENKKNVRNKLGLDLKKKIILFVSSGNTIDKKKGFKILLNALNNIENTSNYHLIILGKLHKNHKENMRVNYTEYNNFFFGESNSLKEIYSAVDIIVVPSLVEAFGQVSLEAAACNVPTLAFKNTGLTEIIIHKKNGYLANYNDVKDLEIGLKWCLNDNNYNYISSNARILAKKKFSYEVVSQKYLDLYENLQSNK